MTAKFHARATLGLKPPNTAHLTARTPQKLEQLAYGLTGHWTGAGGQLFHADPVQRLRGIQAFHMNSLGYGDIAYHGAFDSDGNVYGLRDNRWVGAHAASRNNVANICTNGVVWLEDHRGWTAAAGEAWAFSRGLFAVAHHRPAALWGHSWWGRVGGGQPTECAGAQFTAVIRAEGGLV